MANDVCDMKNDMKNDLIPGFVIVTHERPKELNDCLHSINRLAPNKVDVAIVDNSLSDSTEKLIPEWEKVFQNVQLFYRRIEQSKTVLSAARNLGASIIQSPLIAFVDDDVELSVTWFSSCAAIFEDSKVAAATGRIIEPDTLNLDPSELLPIGRILRNGKMTDNFYLKPSAPVEIDHLRGCNWVVRRNVFDQVGGFSNWFEHVYEEADLSLRISGVGHKIIFHPELEVFHKCAPRANALRKRDPRLRFRQRRANLKFYTFLLLKNYLFSDLRAVKHLTTVDTGILGFLRSPSFEGLNYIVVGVAGKILGIILYIHWMMSERLHCGRTNRQTHYLM